MGATDIAAMIRATALAAIEKQCLGEDFGFDCTMAPMQGPQGIAVVYTMTVTKRSPMLGQDPLMNVSQIVSVHPSAEQVEIQVTQAIRELRDLSSRMLSGQNGHAKPALTS